MPFTVVAFCDDTVECVPTSWLERKNKQLFVYWPSGKHLKRRIINQEIPDKDLWVAHKVRIIGKSEYPDYSTGCIYAKRAEETSNVDSDDGARLGRNKTPHRYQRTDETDPDDDLDVQSVQSEIICLPSAPAFKPSRQDPSAPASSQCHPPSPDTGVHRRPSLPHRDPSSASGICDRQHQSEQSVGMAFNAQILSRLDNLETAIKELKAFLMDKGNHETFMGTDDETLECLLPNGFTINTLSDIAEFEEMMQHIQLRKKIIRSLVNLQGGADIGNICRSYMRSLMTNKLMSMYSVFGQKGKLAFKGTTVFKVILKAIRKSTHEKIPESSVLCEMGDVLRNAPNQPGGDKYKKRRSLSGAEAHHKRQRLSTQFDSDDSN